MSMHTYIGSRIVQAQAMSEQAYDEYRGAWAKPDPTKPVNPGYIFEDPKGSANTLAYKGHVSWLPKCNFESEFTNLGDLSAESPHVQRLHGELAQLHEKLSGLLTFTKSDHFFKLNFKQRELMLEQSRVMTRYIFILEERIAP